MAASGASAYEVSHDTRSRSGSSSSSTTESSFTSKYRGPRGPRGAIGPQGFPGPQGPQGSQGAQGARGFQGPSGVQGNPGTGGYDGPAGFQGVAGVQGAQGAMGVQGDRGSIGLQGPQGFQGPRGPQAGAGTQGLQGAQGAQGASGFERVNFRSFVDEQAFLSNNHEQPHEVTCNSGCDSSCAALAADQCGGLECAENSVCRCARVGDQGAVDDRVQLELTADQFPAMAGLSCEYKIDTRPHVAVEVRTCFRDQPSECCVTHTEYGGAYPGEIATSGAMSCPVRQVDPDLVTLVPETQINVLSGVPACAENQEIVESFESEEAANVVGGFSGRYYFSDRAQPLDSRFVSASPRVELDALSPSAAVLNYFPCSSFYYADTQLGHSDEEAWDVGVALVGGDTIEYAFNFVLAHEHDTTFARDSGDLLIGYFNRQRLFESSVWYSSEHFGLRIFSPINGTGMFQEPSPPVYARLAVEQRNSAEIVSDDFVELQRGTRYRFIGSVSASGGTTTFSARVVTIDLDDTEGYTISGGVGAMTIAFDGSPDSEIEEHDDLSGEFAWNEQRPWALAEDSAGAVTTRTLSNLRVNSFGVYHEDWSEETSELIDGLPAQRGGDDPEGAEQRCWNPRIREARVRGQDRGADLAKRFVETTASTEDTTACEYPVCPFKSEQIPLTVIEDGGSDYDFDLPDGHGDALVDGLCGDSVPAAVDGETFVQLGDGETDYDIVSGAIFRLDGVMPICDTFEIRFFRDLRGVDNGDAVGVCEGTCAAGWAQCTAAIRNVRYAAFEQIGVMMKRQTPDFGAAEMTCCGFVSYDVALEYAVGTSPAGQLILDEITYTVPPTLGYPREGDVKVEATCAGEVYSVEADGVADVLGEAGPLSAMNKRDPEVGEDREANNGLWALGEGACAIDAPYIPPSNPEYEEGLSILVDNDLPGEEPLDLLAVRRFVSCLSGVSAAELWLVSANCEDNVLLEIAIPAAIAESPSVVRGIDACGDIEWPASHIYAGVVDFAYTLCSAEETGMTFDQMQTRFASCGVETLPQTLAPTQAPTLAPTPAPSVV